MRGQHLGAGYGCVDFPNVEDVVGDPEDLAGAIAVVHTLASSFVHPHWLAFDPRHKALPVSGEHTGNVGVVGTYTLALGQVVSGSIFHVGLRHSASADCEMLFRADCLGAGERPRGRKMPSQWLTVVPLQPSGGWHSNQPPGQVAGVFPGGQPLSAHRTQGASDDRR